MKKYLGASHRQTEHDLSHTGAKTNRVNKAVKNNLRAILNRTGSFFSPTAATNFILFIFLNDTSSFKAQFSSCRSPTLNSISGVSRALRLSSHQRAFLFHPSGVYHAVKLSLLSPIGVVNVPLLAQAVAHTPGGAPQSEVSVWKLEGAVRVRPTGRLLGAGVVQVGELQLARHGDELPRLEVQQGHGSQGRLGQEVEEPNQIQTHLGWRTDMAQLRQISVSIN